MNREEGAAIVEAILFTMGESVEISQLAKAMEAEPKEVKECIEYLKEKYNKTDSGIGIIELEKSVQLCTRKEMYEYLVRIAKAPRKAVLTDSLMETLSIIAYKQPITRLEVEKIRGVNSDHAVNRLVEFGLVQELGRLDAPGRPLLFGTTEEFLRSFGVRSLEELPTIGTVQVEEFKAQAEHEINLKLDI